MDVHSVCTRGETREVYSEERRGANPGDQLRGDRTPSAQSCGFEKSQPGVIVTTRCETAGRASNVYAANGVDMGGRVRGVDIRRDGACPAAAVAARGTGVCAGGDVLCGVDVFSAAAAVGYRRLLVWGCSRAIRRRRIRFAWVSGSEGAIGNFTGRDCQHNASDWKLMNFGR